MTTQPGEGISSLEDLRDFLERQAGEAAARIETSRAARLTYETEHPLKFSSNRLRRLSRKAMIYFGLADERPGDKTWRDLEEEEASAEMEKADIVSDLERLKKLADKVSTIYERALTRQPADNKLPGDVPKNFFVQSFERPANTTN